MADTVHSSSFRAMASPCEVVIADRSADEAAALALAVQQEVERIEHKYSRYRDDSVISELNRNSGGAAVQVDDETLQLLRNAATLYSASHGLFDITAGVLRRAWRFSDAVVPPQAAIDALLPLINWTRVERDGNSVRLPVAGMELDFGGFGKEYAADQGAALLQAAGVHHGYVNLGGDVRVLGPKPGGEPWQIGIQHPRKADLVATLPVTQGALATSGDYERFFECDGKRYCHVLNARTGMPVRWWQSVSVLAPTTLLAGSFCTIAMLFEQDGLHFLQQSGLPFLAIDHNGRCWQPNAAQPASTTNSHSPSPAVSR